MKQNTPNKKFSNLNVHSIRYNMGKYNTEHHAMPDGIVMNPPTYMEFRLVNATLPENPRDTMDDSFHSISGVKVYVVDSSRNGYEFKAPFDDDVLLP